MARCAGVPAVVTMWTLPGNTTTNSAAQASPPSRRVRGSATSPPQTSSATPDPSAQARFVPGNQSGSAGSKTCGRTR